MIASFQSFPLMLEEYQMFGFVPLLAPLKAIPFITSERSIRSDQRAGLTAPTELLFMFLETHFDTATALPVRHHRVRASVAPR